MEFVEWYLVTNYCSG